MSPPHSAVTHGAGSLERRLGGLREAAVPAGPAQVLDYVGRHDTHRVAISNNRLVSMDDGKVRLRWKDYTGMTIARRP